MKRKFIVGILATSLVGCAWWAFSGEAEEVQSAYTPRDVNTEVTGIHGYQAYLDMLHTNVNTGKVEPTDLIRGRIQAEKFAQTNGAKAVNLTWEDRGPDNIGGRTRAIHVIKSSPNQVFAGSVTGGLWYSNTEGNWWQRVWGFNENLAVSSVAQTGNGRLFVATGCRYDSPSEFEGSGSAGNGIWWSDDISVNGTYTVIPASQPNASTFNTGSLKSQWNVIKADVNQADKLWAGGNDGLWTYTDADGFTEFTRVETDGSTGSFQFVGDIVLSADGQTIIVAEASGGIRTWISYDAGGTWENVSGTGTGEIPFGGVGRATYAISPDDKNWIYAVQVTSAGSLKAIYHSMDGGQSWDEIGVGNNTTFDPFSFLGSNLGSQGIYDQCVTVLPGKKDEILVGGIQLWKWKQTQTSPSFGQWQQAAFQGAVCQQCVHSDVHTFEWNPNDQLYIGTDGGIYITPTTDLDLFYPSNRGYNVTQFYAMDFSKNDAMLGGTQDNGTLYIDGSGMTWQEAASVRGGDGFESEIAFINSDVMYSSVYNGDIMRSDDAGGGWSYFWDTRSTNDLETWFNNGAAGSPFYTVMALWENPMDLTSQDSLLVVVNQDYNPGDTIFYTSATIQVPLWTVATSQVDSLDTLLLQDPVQSLFAAGLGTQGVQVTRDGMRFATQPEWWPVMTDAQISGTVHSLEFSDNGNHLFVGTTSGDVYIVSGLNQAYDDSSVINGVTFQQFTGGNSGVVTDIAVDPQDEDHIVVTYGGFGGINVWESNNATTGASLTQIMGDLPTNPRVPVYGAIIDRNDPNLIVIGTEYGVYATDNGGVNWTDQNATMERVPTFDVRQQHRGWDEGVFNPGMIYLGTHGRGFWSSASLLSTRPYKPMKEVSYTPDIQVYPNPVVDQTELRYELAEGGNVSVELYDLNGRLVRSIQTIGGAGQNVLTIDAGDLPSGAYLINFLSGEDRRTGKMLVK